MDPSDPIEPTTSQEPTTNPSPPSTIDDNDIPTSQTLRASSPSAPAVPDTEVTAPPLPNGIAGLLRDIDFLSIATLEQARPKDVEFPKSFIEYKSRFHFAGVVKQVGNVVSEGRIDPHVSVEVIDFSTHNDSPATIKVFAEQAQDLQQIQVGNFFYYYSPNPALRMCAVCKSDTRNDRVRATITSNCFKYLATFPLSKTIRTDEELKIALKRSIMAHVEVQYHRNAIEQVKNLLADEVDS